MSENDDPERDGPRTHRRRVLLVEDDSLVGIGLKAQLERLGHEVVGQASTAAEALDMFTSRGPDIVLLDIRLDGADGIDLAGRIMTVRRVPMIVVSAFSDKSKIERAGAAGVFGYLIKPVSGESLAAQIEVAVQRFNQQERLVHENQELTLTLENRKLVEKAKGIFMKRLNLDEPEAHRRLQQESQKRRISIAELAKRLLNPNNFWADDDIILPVEAPQGGRSRGPRRSHRPNHGAPMRPTLFNVVLGVVAAVPVLLSSSSARAQAFLGGATAFTPQISTVESGASLDVQATVSADRRYVTMTMRPQLSTLLDLRSFAFQQGNNALGYVGIPEKAAANGAARTARTESRQTPWVSARPSVSILQRQGMMQVSRPAPSNPSPIKTGN